MNAQVKSEPKERRTRHLGVKILPSMYERIVSAIGAYGSVSKFVEAAIAAALAREESK